MTPAISIHLSPVCLFEHSRDCWNNTVPRYRFLVSFDSIRSETLLCPRYKILSGIRISYPGWLPIFIHESLPRSSISLPKSFGTGGKVIVHPSLFPSLTLSPLPRFPLILLRLHWNVSIRCLSRYAHQHLWCSFYRIFWRLAAGQLCHGNSPRSAGNCIGDFTEETYLSPIFVKLIVS